MNDTTLVIACPHCGGLNRLPVALLAQEPACGRCHQSLFVGKPIVLDAAAFARHVERSGLPMLVDFWAPWCGPCLSMAPQFEAAAHQLEPRMRLGKVDTEAEPALAARFAIRSIPTMLLFDQGREIARHSGAVGTAQIVAWAQSELLRSNS